MSADGYQVSCSMLSITAFAAPSCSGIQQTALLPMCKHLAAACCNALKHYLGGVTPRCVKTSGYCNGNNTISFSCCMTAAWPPTLSQPSKATFVPVGAAGNLQDWAWPVGALRACLPVPISIEKVRSCKHANTADSLFMSLVACAKC